MADIPGQAPAVPPQAGGAPPAAPVPPAAPPAQEPQTFDRAYVETLRAEAASRRVSEQAAQAELKKLQDAQLSESEKIKKAGEEAATRATTLEGELRQERALREVERSARKLNIVDEETAMLLIRSKIEYDKDGKATNIEPLLTQLVKDKPFLIGQAAPPAGNPGNPAGGRGSTLTMEAIKTMTREQLDARYDEVRQFLQNHK